MLDKNVDIYRDTPVRYLGYANEIGEAFRAFIGHRMVLGTYGIATAYVFADAFDKTNKCYNNNATSNKRLVKTVYTATDTIVWQMLASVMIPGFTINRVCAFTSYLLNKSTPLPDKTRKIIVTAIGLATIPFIIKPIDHATDELLDHTIRKLAP
ncbi:uncharacterized protein CBL_02428 [Carabus blaptoides fortunei]